VFLFVIQLKNCHSFILKSLLPSLLLNDRWKSFIECFFLLHSKQACQLCFFPVDCEAG